MTEVSARVRAMFEEAALPGGGDDELVDLLAGLEQRYVDDSAPEPGPQLARLLDGGQPGEEGTRASRLSRRSRRFAAASALALSTVVGTGVAAAANELPPPAQRWVAELSERFLHVDLPRPATAPAEVVKARPGGGGRDAETEEHGARLETPSGPQMSTGPGEGMKTATPARSGLRERRDGADRDETTRDETTPAERDDGGSGDVAHSRTRVPEPGEDAASDDTATRESAASTDGGERLHESREVEGAGAEDGRDG